MPLPRQSRGLIRPDTSEQEIVMFVKSIPHLSPADIAARIAESGYIGQQRAVMSVALMAYRHVSRLRKCYLEGIDRELLPTKTNLLFVGPTGSGKTFLVELLFKKILELPTVIVDMTGFSETGYVGQDATSILTRLLYAADLSPAAAAVGVVCLDEFDKVASGQNNAVFAGAGTTKDVSGMGVQRELLKMLESTELSIPVEMSHSDYAPRAVISTGDIAFIACGAFSGFKGMIENRTERIGFGSAVAPAAPTIAVTFTEEDVDIARNFQDYGFLPELIGRFKRIVPFHALSIEQLKQILEDSILKRYRNEFMFEGIELSVQERVLDRIVGDGFRKETGARGLESALVRSLESAAYRAYSTPGASRIDLAIGGAGEIVFDVT